MPQIKERFRELDKIFTKSTRTNYQNVLNKEIIIKIINFVQYSHLKYILTIDAVRKRLVN